MQILTTGKGFEAFKSKFEPLILKEIRSIRMQIRTIRKGFEPFERDSNHSNANSNHWKGIRSIWLPVGGFGPFVYLNFWVCFLSQLAQMVTSGWWMVQSHQWGRAEWRSATTMLMVQCVMIAGTQLMLEWCVDNWGWTDQKVISI